MLTQAAHPNGGFTYSGPAHHDTIARIACSGAIVSTEHISCAERLQFAVDYNLAAAAVGAPTRLDITRIL